MHCSGPHSASRESGMWVECPGDNRDIGGRVRGKVTADKVEVETMIEAILKSLWL